MELPELPQHPGVSFKIQDATYLYFGGTAYLGMSSVPEFLDSLSRHTARWGAHWGASRIGNLRLDIYANAEAAVAQWTGSPAACTLSSGFLAGRLLTEAFPKKDYDLFFAPSCHAALLPAGAERFTNWDALRQALEHYAAHRSNRLAVVFSDTLDFSDGPASLLPVLDSLPKAGVILVADDSHGIGITGPNGVGAYPELNSLGFDECLVSASLGKAMGVTAGVILGTQSRIAGLKTEPLFSGASPAPPAAMAAMKDGLEQGWYASQLKRLRENIDYVLAGLPPHPGLRFQADYPVITFQDPQLAKHLFHYGIVLTHFDYPAEAGSISPSRIVISAAHNRAHLDLLIRGLSEYYTSQ